MVESRIGRRIRRYRKDKNLTIRKFSEISGVSTALVSQLERGIGNTTRAIDETLKETNAQAIIAVGFVPWWAVARAPYVALPLAQRHNHTMIGITVGCRRLEDRKALDIAARLEKVIKKL